LPNAKRDAQVVAASLREVGFQSVVEGYDLDKRRLENTLQSFAQQATTANWAVIYYAGHGIEVGGTNYLIPVDAKLATDRDVSFEAVPLDHVMLAAEGAKKLHLVLLDACRDNPFARTMQRTASIRDDVMKATDRHQLPFHYGSLPGDEDFFFRWK
jgi:uncharacterized caspase-like protein